MKKKITFYLGGIIILVLISVLIWQSQKEVWVTVEMPYHIYNYLSESHGYSYHLKSSGIEAIDIRNKNNIYGHNSDLIVELRNDDLYVEYKSGITSDHIELQIGRSTQSGYLFSSTVDILVKKKSLWNLERKLITDTDAMRAIRYDKKKACIVLDMLTYQFYDYYIQGGLGEEKSVNVYDIANKIDKLTSFNGYFLGEEGINEEIERITKELTKNETEDKDKIKKISEWVNKNIKNRSFKDQTEKVTISYCLREKEGNCTTKSYVTMIMLNSIGVKNKLITGYTNINGELAAHQFNAFYDDTRNEWIWLDTTMGYFGPPEKFPSQFTQSKLLEL